MAAQRRPSPPPKRGPTGKVMDAVLAFALWIALGALANIALEWVGMKFLWPQEGARHSYQTLADELGYLDADFPEGLIVERPALFSRQMAAGVYHTVYEDWRLGEVFRRKADAPRPDSFGGRVQALLGEGSDYLMAAVCATQVYAIRLGVMVCALPVFLLAGLVAAVDGFGQRDLRRFGGGRERGHVYHLARNFVFPAFTLPWVLYLDWPDTVHPAWFVLPFAALFGWLVSTMTGSFKKYL
jgi:integrating conjugative element membrane protein (TIGR03747 family)